MLKYWIRFWLRNQNDLEIMISSDVKSSQQCVVACNKANRVLGMISRTISYKEQWMMVNLFKSLVRPHFEQCVSVWSPHYQKDKDYKTIGKS